MEQKSFPRLHDPNNYKDHKHLIITSPTFNKGTAFSSNERELFKLRGLIPNKVETLDQQLKRVETQFYSFPKPIDAHIYLSSLKERNETLFYAFTLRNLKVVMPIIYTPTVGEACILHSRNLRVPQGMIFSKEDKGLMRSMLENWTYPNVSIIVVTDGSRILGLGDLGANGMGIPIGKLSLYVAAAGFHPSTTLPVMLDFGTNNESLLNDDLYIGARHKRVPDDEYYELVEEFMVAVKDKWPNCLVQFEDFSNDHCFDLLENYKNRMLCFNDDIQGTGAVVTSGFLNATKLSEVPLKDHKIVFFGAGSAAVGVAKQIVHQMILQGISKEDALSKFWLVDSSGLVTNNRGGQLQDHKVLFARKDIPKDGQLKTLVEVVKHVKPTALIGLSGQGKAFTEEILREMANFNKKPIVFPLSNPTSKSECTAEEAYKFTDGTSIFASGSPFDPVNWNGKELVPGQGNNMYIFPGLGFGAQICKAKKVSQNMIASASKALADSVSQEELDEGKLYPEISKIREISVNIAVAVIETAYEQNLTSMPDRKSVV